PDQALALDLVEALGEAIARLPAECQGPLFAVGGTAHFLERCGSLAEWAAPSRAARAHAGEAPFLTEALVKSGRLVLAQTLAELASAFREPCILLLPDGEASPLAHLEGLWAEQAAARLLAVEHPLGHREETRRLLRRIGSPVDLRLRPSQILRFLGCGAQASIPVVVAVGATSSGAEVEDEMSVGPRTLGERPEKKQNLRQLRRGLWEEVLLDLTRPTAICWLPQDLAVEAMRLVQRKRPGPGLEAPRGASERHISGGGFEGAWHLDGTLVGWAFRESAEPATQFAEASLERGAAAGELADFSGDALLSFAILQRTPRDGGERPRRGESAGGPSLRGFRERIGELAMPLQKRVEASSSARPEPGDGVEVIVPSLGHARVVLNSEELSPQSDVASLCQSFGHLTVVWMRAAEAGQIRLLSDAFAALKSFDSACSEQFLRPAELALHAKVCRLPQLSLAQYHGKSPIPEFADRPRWAVADAVVQSECRRAGIRRYINAQGQQRKEIALASEAPAPAAKKPPDAQRPPPGGGCLARSFSGSGGGGGCSGSARTD
ncbi:unnamed protein product, partial [Polarella glacialis]